jgi:hypothetical protein
MRHGEKKQSGEASYGGFPEAGEVCREREPRA